MVPFGGWEMPLAYPTGTLTEHRACREDAVAFDVSHLGTVRLKGPAAKATIQAAFTNDIDKIAPGRAQYTHLLDEVDASVLDDIIVWWIAQDVFDAFGMTSNRDSSIHHTMMSSSTDASSASRRWVYCARPGAILPRSLVNACCNRSLASAPTMRTVPR